MQGVKFATDEERIAARRDSAKRSRIKHPETAERSRKNYMESLKNNPDKYRHYLEMHRKSSSKYYYSTIKNKV